jgi:hypothetical protein
MPSAFAICASTSVSIIERTSHVWLDAHKRAMLNSHDLMHDP